MEYNDDLLIYYIHLHNKTAYEILYDKYLRLTKIILSKNIDFAILGDSEINDLIQECLLAFNRAIYSYRNEEGTFYMYFHSIITNVLTNNLKQIKNRRNKEIYECEQKEDQKNLFLYLSDSIQINEEYSCEEERKYIKKQCKNELENNIVYLKQEGYTYKEIAEMLNINVKKVDYVLSIIKKKYKKFFD